MSSRASGGALAACLIAAAIVGFAGGAYFGSQADGTTPTASESGASGDSTTPVGETPASETPAASETPTGENGITLTAAQTAVAPNERIDLAGAVDPPAEGVQLRLERSVDGGDWEKFPLNQQPVTRSDGTFNTWVQTGQSGTNAFRLVVEGDDAVVSNEVQVAVS